MQTSALMNVGSIDTIIFIGIKLVGANQIMSKNKIENKLEKNRSIHICPHSLFTNLLSASLFHNFSPIIVFQFYYLISVYIFLLPDMGYLIVD